MKNMRRLLAFLLVVVFIFVNTIIGFAEEEEKEAKKEDPNVKYIQLVKQYIKQKYKFDVTDEALIEGALDKVIEEHPEVLDTALKGMFETLDQHSVYFDKQEYDSFSVEVGGEFGGIGVSVGKRNGHIAVIAPIEGTPGDRAGLKPGDEILAIDGTDVSEYDTDKAVTLMRGAPGTKVNLGVRRKGDMIYYEITRELIKVNPISHKILENNIGYIKISSFNDNTVINFRQALKEFDKAGIKKVILDVRYNPGGSLQQVVEIAKNFIPDKGPIVHIDYKDPNQKESFYSTLEQKKYDVAILINEGSASASEILAGAIQDSKAGTVIGTKSFGKGTVQNVLPLKKGGAIKLTIARYLTPNGRIIDGDGIHPDIEVKNSTKKADLSDLQAFSYETKPEMGDTGKDVLAAEQRLSKLGYLLNEPDENLDQGTVDAIKSFQTNHKLFAYGVLDLTTQHTLDEVMDKLEEEVDDQLQKAIDVLSTK